MAFDPTVLVGDRGVDLSDEQMLQYVGVTLRPAMRAAILGTSPAAS